MSIKPAHAAEFGYLRYQADGTAALAITGASYGAHGQGARIGYAIVDTEFGKILAAATIHGLCWVGVQQSAERLERELRDDFRRAGLITEDRSTTESARRVAAIADGAAGTSEFALDLPATPFQLAVWRELCAIPRGATRSYGEIALRIGNPAAARAVGRANGSNPLAIAIPCHRAIGAGGTLTGYRWGVEYKRHLLAHERAIVPPELPLTAARGAPGAG